MPDAPKGWTATRYAPPHPPHAPPPLTIEYRGVGWAVVDGSACLSRDGEWEFERLPSARDEAYFLRTRYSLEEAFKAAEEWLATHDLWRGAWVKKGSSPGNPPTQLAEAE